MVEERDDDVFGVASHVNHLTINDNFKKFNLILKNLNLIKNNK